MNAITYTRQGSPDVLQLKTVARPQPKESEVLIRVHAGSVTAGDVIMRRLHPMLVWAFHLFGMKRRQIPGVELAGTVAAVGSAVTRFQVGDSVFGTTTGLGAGANAEYVCVPEAWKMGVIALKPATASFEEAAVLPVGAMTALFLLRKAGIEPGQKVLVYGASGSVGAYAVQLARHLGAEVTGLASGPNLELVASLGAGRTLDYTQEHWVEGAGQHDVVFDAVRKLPSTQARRLLKAGGRKLSVASPTSERIDDLLVIKELVEAGSLKAVIDRRYPLEQVAEAHRYVETGHKRGNVVITVIPD
jgi:NADPH:quinone reductase-like Zn-dependent oxidoreductase